MMLNNNLNIMIVGSGGREHALAWKLAQSLHIRHIYLAPGNGGTALLPKVENVELATSEYAKISQFCLDKKVDLVIVGPDNPLAEGIVDILTGSGLRVFGPDKRAARLEASKVYAKEFMSRFRLPTARYLVCDSFAQGENLVKEHPWAQVVKVDGLALGKGVFVCDSQEEAISALRVIFKEKKFGNAGKRVVLEERLSGEEISLLVFCDGKHLLPLPSCQDHKRRFDGDKGPNTGGMGAFAPVEIYKHAKADIESQILLPIQKILQARRLAYQGVLYLGLLVEIKRFEAGKRSYQPYILEFNARFGDPETQVILPLMISDLLPVLWATTEGKLKTVELEWSRQASCCVVATTASYPESSASGDIIKIGSLPPDTLVFHSGTRKENDKLVTSGGRILSVTGLAASLPAAIEKAYNGLAAVSFSGMAYRKDIGRRQAFECLSR